MQKSKGYDQCVSLQKTKIYRDICKLIFKKISNTCINMCHILTIIKTIYGLSSEDDDLDPCTCNI